MIVTIKHYSNSTKTGAYDANGVLQVKYENCFDKFIPGMSRVSGRLNTGLDASQEEHYEGLLGLTKGALSREGSYWNEFAITIPSSGMILNTDNPLHDLYHTVLKADPSVCLTLEAARSSSKVAYLMTSEEDLATDRNKTRDIKAKAYAKYLALSQSEIADVLMVMGKNIKGLSMNIVSDMLGEVIEKSPVSFLTVVSDPEFTSKVFVCKAITLGIITRQTMSPSFDQPLWFEDTSLGDGLSSAIKFFKDKANQAVYLAIKKQME